ncbi:YMGG-like glycine zipper-containing protein, partial [Escherichia sp. HC-CC]
PLPVSKPTPAPSNAPFVVRFISAIAGVGAVTEKGRDGKNARKGAKVGAAVGAVTGVLTGNGLEGAIKGAVIGGTGGAILGKMK